VKPQFAINDIDLAGVRSVPNFTPAESVVKILQRNPEASLCLVRTSSVGDILLMTPMFYRIKELFPLCRLLFATVPHYEPLFRYFDLIETVKIKLVEYQDYDFGYDFNLALERAERAGWGKQYHRSAIYARLLGLELTEYRYALAYSEKEKRMAEQILVSKGYTGGPLVAFQLRGASAQRSFPLSKAKRIIEKLSERVQVALIDGDPSVGWTGSNVINLCGATGLLELAAVLDMCELVVSTDSGLTHMAGSLGKKNVAFFACIPSENRVRYPHCRVVDLATLHGCRPCWEDGDRCGRGWHCLQKADEGVVYERIMESL